MSFNFAFKMDSKLIDTHTLYDFVSVGGGPASMNAVLYSQRKGLKTLMIAKKLGGNLLNTDQVENYLGLSLVSGEGLSHAFEEHLRLLDVELLSDTSVKSIQKIDQLFHIEIESGEIIKSKTLLVATGSEPKHLNVLGEETYKNSGVAYCAICDAPLYKGKTVVIAGGGNSAVEAAIDVAKYATKTIVVHRSEFRADEILLKRLRTIDGIEIYTQTQIVELVGSNKLESIKVLDKNTQQERLIETQGIFIEIGHVAHSNLVHHLVEVNQANEIVVDEKQRTSCEGLYAAGDVTNSPYKQIIIAVADGAKAALGASEYINNH